MMGTQEGVLILLGGLPGWKGSLQTAYLAVSFLFHVATSILTYPSLMTRDLHPTATPLWVTAQPPDPIQEGGNVTFIPQMSAKYFSECSWYRERTGDLQELIIAHEKGNLGLYITGEASTGRETIGPDCSLHITSIVPADDGVYTVHMDGAGTILAIGHVILTVVENETSPWGSSPWQDENLKILVGTIGAVVALILIALSLWYCARCLKNSRSPTVIITPTAPAPAPLPPPPSYENLFPSGQAEPEVDSTASPESPREVSGTSQHTITKDN